MPCNTYVHRPPLLSFTRREHFACMPRGEVQCGYDDATQYSNRQISKNSGDRHGGDHPSIVPPNFTLGPKRSPYKSPLSDNKHPPTSAAKGIRSISEDEKRMNGRITIPPVAPDTRLPPKLAACPAVLSGHPQGRFDRISRHIVHSLA